MGLCPAQPLMSRVYKYKYIARGYWSRCAVTKDSSGTHSSKVTYLDVEILGLL